MRKQLHPPARPKVTAESKTMSVSDWVQEAPLARIKRRELIVILDAIGLITKADCLTIVTRALKEYRWWRRLYRWIKAKVTRPKKSLGHLRPEALDQVQAKVDAARKEQAERVGARQNDTSPDA